MLSRDQIDRRDVARQTFLARHAGPNAVAEPLVADASFRRYFRVRGAAEPLLLMDAPPPREDVRPYVRVAAHLNRLGFSAPRVSARDEQQGFLLLEDFGDCTFTQ